MTLTFDKYAIKQLKQYAESHPLNSEEMGKINKGQLPMAVDRAFHVLELPDNIRLCYCVEQVPTINVGNLWVRHVTLSNNRSSFAPDVESFKEIFNLLEFPGLTDCQINIDSGIVDVIAPLISKLPEKLSMNDEIVLSQTFDVHTHLRENTEDDNMLDYIVALTVPTWAAVLAMPNTNSIIDSPGKAVIYRRAAIGDFGDRFDVFPTLYFQTHYTRNFLEEAKPHIVSIKFYPKGLTTNSSHGCCPDDPEVLNVLASMEELDIPLNVHPEAEGYYHDREQLFQKYIRSWAKMFPNLRIVMEHLSDGTSVQLLELPNVYATVTPQHLLTSGNDWFGPPFNRDLYCMPCVKRPSDRLTLLHAAMFNYPEKMMAGTDSAPHTENRKIQCGCAGVFSAPIALQLYTQAFDRLGMSHMLQAFVSDNAKKFYNVTLPNRQTTLIRKPFIIPERYGNVIPMWAGKTIDWSVK